MRRRCQMKFVGNHIADGIPEYRRCASIAFKREVRLDTLAMTVQVYACNACQTVLPRPQRCAAPRTSPSLSIWSNCAALMLALRCTAHAYESSELSLLMFESCSAPGPSPSATSAGVCCCGCCGAEGAGAGGAGDGDAAADADAEAATPAVAGTGADGAADRGTLSVPCRRPAGETRDGSLVVLTRAGSHNRRSTLVSKRSALRGGGGGQTVR